VTTLAAITWRLPAHAAHWLPDEDLSAVTAWMADNNLDRATAQAPVEVADGQITYGGDRSPSTVRAAHREIVTVTVPLRTLPPAIAEPSCSAVELAALQEVFLAHEWSAGFDGVCVDCSRIRLDESGRAWCHRDDAVAWPCPPVRAALVRAGFGVPAGQAGRILGDCLDPADNARAGIAVSAATFPSSTPAVSA
jgi:hypothetical protein